jgi:hypothetical protein
MMQLQDSQGFEMTVSTRQGGGSESRNFRFRTLEALFDRCSGEICLLESPELAIQNENGEAHGEVRHGKAKVLTSGHQ